MEYIKIENIDFGYTDDLVIKNLNLSIEEGELVILIGSNGSGKSTLIKLILGELKPLKGQIKILGKDIQKKSKITEIGYVPQMNVMEKVAFPVTCLEFVVLGLYDDFGLIKIPKQRHFKKAKEVLEEMGLSEYINVPFNELSGGLQQRVLISRAMINKPKILLMDEPTSGVDQKSKESFLTLINEINKTQKIPLLFVTHEIELVREFLSIDKIYKMSYGDIENVRI